MRERAGRWCASALLSLPGRGDKEPADLAAAREAREPRSRGTAKAHKLRTRWLGVIRDEGLIEREMSAWASQLCKGGPGDNRSAAIRRGVAVSLEIEMEALSVRPSGLELKSSGPAVQNAGVWYVLQNAT